MHSSGWMWGKEKPAMDDAKHNESRRMAYETDFRAFWVLYPVKRDRLDALRAYQRVRAKGVAHVEILAGLHDYLRHKPAWQAWKHPATWLNKGGWLDEWDAPPMPVFRVDWAAECREMHGGACGLSQRAHDQRKQMDEFRAKSKASA